MGTLIVFAGGMLLWDVPRVLFPGVPVSTSAEFLYVLACFMGVAALMLPFDLVGGILIPAARESRSPNPRVWLRQWFRSVSIQSLFFSVTFFIYLQTGRGIGAQWLAALSLALFTAMSANQNSGR